jgi:hypothetical protein
VTMRRQWFGQESSLGSYCQLRANSVYHEHCPIDPTCRAFGFVVSAVLCSLFGKQCGLLLWFCIVDVSHSHFLCLNITGPARRDSISNDGAIVFVLSSGSWPQAYKFQEVHWLIQIWKGLHLQDLWCSFGRIQTGGWLTVSNGGSLLT